MVFRAAAFAALAAGATFRGLVRVLGRYHLGSSRAEGIARRRSATSARTACVGRSSAFTEVPSASRAAVTIDVGVTRAAGREPGAPQIGGICAVGRKSTSEGIGGTRAADRESSSPWIGSSWAAGRERTAAGSGAIRAAGRECFAPWIGVSASRGQQRVRDLSSEGCSARRGPDSIGNTLVGHRACLHSGASSIPRLAEGNVLSGAGPGALAAALGCKSATVRAYGVLSDTALGVGHATAAPGVVSHAARGSRH